MFRIVVVAVLFFLFFIPVLFANTTYVFGGEIASGIWIKEFSPYKILDSIRLSNGNGLYIEHGCELLFEDNAAFIISSGSKLIAGISRCPGDPTDSVWFKYAGDEDDTLVGWDGLRFQDAAKCTLRNSHISGVVIREPAGYGAIVNNNSELIIENCLIQDNIGGGSGGGGVYLESTRPSCIRDCDILNNKSFGHGGGLYVSGTDVVCIDGNFIDNNELLDGSKDGGGAYISGSVLFSDNTVTWNKSFHDGGGLFLNNFSGNVIRPILHFNLAYRRGGALAIAGGEAEIIQADICYNYSLSLEGAGVYTLNNGVATFINSIIAHNDGGGLWCTSTLMDDCIKVINSTIANNYSGPGIHIGFTYGGADLLLFNSVVAYNSRSYAACEQILLESTSNLWVDHSFVNDLSAVCNNGSGSINMIYPDHFIFGSPNFVDTTECNLGFTPGCESGLSPLIDAGAPYTIYNRDTVWAPLDDYIGNVRYMDFAYDLGAIENSCLGMLERGDLPESNSLISARPNPFNSTLAIEFQVARESEVSIDIFDVSGRKVETIFCGRLTRGYHIEKWQSNELSSGVYNIKLVIGGEIFHARATLLK
ncbi:right-handed parallel beta-helix repeat-containing protein [bacterium]|nr:right-handed parallel beta-helix repeat-containing protein [bacterium]